MGWAGAKVGNESEPVRELISGSIREAYVAVGLAKHALEVVKEGPATGEGRGDPVRTKESILVTEEVTCNVRFQGVHTLGAPCGCGVVRFVVLIS